jgi:hypothetical protein
VQAGPITFPSGVALSLHIVANYFSQSVAQNAADYMECQSRLLIPDHEEVNSSVGDAHLS